jgi:hypothetical protein
VSRRDLTSFAEIAAATGLTREGARQACHAAERKFCERLHEVLEQRGLTLDDLFAEAADCDSEPLTVRLLDRISD